MRFDITSFGLSVVLFRGLATAAPTQPSFIPHPDRAEAVREAFRHAWKGYRQYAFPHDELHPISNGYGDSRYIVQISIFAESKANKHAVRNGWGASAIDALSTAIVMGEGDIVNQIVQFVPNIDFTKTSSSVSLFETTIRYLAGLLSGYDFLGPQGPRKNLLKNGLVSY
jgi:mannosyl-oligosaccharide alpha-1,2-mannosidase